MNELDIALDHKLQMWADWHQSEREDIGYPSRAAGFKGTGLNSFDDMCAEGDKWACRVIDAKIDSLPVANRAAIFKCYGISSVFRFPRDNYAELLEDALMMLAVSLRREGVL